MQNKIKNLREYQKSCIKTAQKFKDKEKERTGTKNNSIKF